MLVDKKTVVVERLRQSWLALSIVGMGAVSAIWWNQQVTQKTPVPVSLPPQIVQIPPSAPPQVARVPAAPVMVNAASVDDLRTLFSDRSYSLTTVRQEGAAVPRLLVTGVPGDIGGMVDVKERKAVFLQMMLPLVLRANEAILADRERLRSMEAKLAAGDTLSAADKTWLELMGAEYGAKGDDLKTLIARVDVVPPSLALAQAAIESGWGTSRFAREGNALFGQWTTSEGNGMIPAKRDADKGHKVRSYNTPLDAVLGYMKNLNTHSAYSGFRAERQKMRKDGRPLSGMALAAELKAYSEKGNKYVELVRHVIQFNKLKTLNAAQLAPAPGRPTGV